MTKVIHIWCDESDKKGKYFSNFYGGVLVKDTHLIEVNSRLKKICEEQNLLKELKWQKVTSQYLNKYIAIIEEFFNLIQEDKIKVRIMFTSNSNKPLKLEEGHKRDEYFLLYYQFFKHAFGLKYCNQTNNKIHLRINFDHLPDTSEKKFIFKDYIHRLQDQNEFKLANLIIDKDHISEVDSNQHLILQCMDVVLGSISFRLNDKHKEKEPESKNRGKRTIAKEKLYKYILKQIRKIRPNFNIGISTGNDGDNKKSWEHSYSHWLFVPSVSEKDQSFFKPKGSQLPT